MEEQEKIQERRRANKSTFFVIFAFLALWLIGISIGEPGRVLEDAIRVCLSCIGVG